ncbi:MAG: glycosyltransferase [Lachnospiraceae bacterium]|nr:glycosyltransferase [Lachnospiraceae bacterium]
MLKPKIPYRTIEGKPTEELRKLKNSLIDFEELGFATGLNESPEVYANRQLELLRELIADEKLWMTYADEITGLFVKEYFLRTTLMAADEYLWETLNLSSFAVQFKNMQKVVNEVFPYWIDNDYLYSLGKNMLNILKAANMGELDEETLGMLLKDVAILGMPPSVSIIMPTYNRGEKLLNTIPKILNQTYDSFELIVVDDGSDDNTKEVLQMFGDDRIKYLKLEKNGGQAAARNAGIKQASFNYIAFADSDDFWDERKLEIQMDKFIKEKESGFCYCAYTYHDEEDKTYTVPKKEISKVRKEGYIYPELLRRNLVGTPSLIVKKECIDAIGGFNEELDCLEDWEFALRLARNFEAAFCPEELFDVYEDTDKVSTKTKADGEEAMKHFYDSFERDRELFGMVDEVF